MLLSLNDKIVTGNEDFELVIFKIKSQQHYGICPSSKCNVYYDLAKKILTLPKMPLPLIEWIYYLSTIFYYIIFPQYFINTPVSYVFLWALLNWKNLQQVVSWKDWSWRYCHFPWFLFMNNYCTFILLTLPISLFRKLLIFILY